jgi:hypothetical protein
MLFAFDMSSYSIACTVMLNVQVRITFVKMRPMKLYPMKLYASLAFLNNRSGMTKELSFASVSMLVFSLGAPLVMQPSFILGTAWN